MLENQVPECYMLKIQDSDSVWVLKSLTLFGPSFLTALKRAWPVDSQFKKVEKWKKKSYCKDWRGLVTNQR